jgi:hypothetical protein
MLIGREDAGTRGPRGNPRRPVWCTPPRTVFPCFRIESPEIRLRDALLQTRDGRASGHHCGADFCGLPVSQKGPELETETSSREVTEYDRHQERPHLGGGTEYETRPHHRQRRPPRPARLRRE